MAYRKNSKFTEKFKREDNDISSEPKLSSVNSNLLEKYTNARGNVSSVFSKKSKFPIGLDIFISLLLIVLVASLIVGAYFLIDRFDNAHDTREIEYLVLVDKSSVQSVNKGDNLYFDKENSAIYFGRVYSINDRVDVYDESEGVEYVLLVVHADVQYRDDEGYSLDGVRIAVGKELSARVGGYSFTGEVVGITHRNASN